MKRLICGAAAVLMLAALPGCGSRESANTDDVSAIVATIPPPPGTDPALYTMTSAEVAADMIPGWNLGNTLDVCIADRDGDGKVNETPAAGEEVTETLWGNVMTSPELFTELKAQGIKSVRIPVTWRDHTGEAPTYTIDPQWMARVHEVADYALDAGLYVIINVHHDGGGDPRFGAWIRDASKDFDAVEERYTAVWTQISDSFADYSGKLIFESMNEVGFDDMNKRDAYETLNKLNQTFVDVVRNGPGNDPNRHLLIAGYWTDTEMTCSDMFKMPEDPAGRCMVSVHYYTPWEFCTTSRQRTWGTDREVARMKSDISKLSKTFVSAGVPVVIGEYGMGAGNDPDSRVKFAGTLTELCRAQGIPCFFWDNGEELDRTDFTWTTEGLLQAITGAADE